MTSESEAPYWNQFCAVIAKQLDVPVERVERKALFIGDLGADSLDIVSLLMELEDQFHVTIPEEAAAQLETVGAFFDYISAQMAASEG